MKHWNDSRRSKRLFVFARPDHGRKVFPWTVHTAGMDYPAARRIQKKFGQLAIARDHMTICVDDWKGAHSSPPWQFFPVRYFSNLPFGLQCSQRLFVSVLFRAHPALLTDSMDGSRSRVPLAPANAF